MVHALNQGIFVSVTGMGIKLRIKYFLNNEIQLLSCDRRTLKYISPILRDIEWEYISRYGRLDIYFYIEYADQINWGVMKKYQKDLYYYIISNIIKKDIIDIELIDELPFLPHSDMVDICETSNDIEIIKKIYLRYPIYRKIITYRGDMTEKDKNHIMYDIDNLDYNLSHASNMNSGKDVVLTDFELYKYLLTINGWSNFTRLYITGTHTLPKLTSFDYQRLDYPLIYSMYKDGYITNISIISKFGLKYVNRIISEIRKNIILKVSFIEIYRVYRFLNNVDWLSLKIKNTHSDKYIIDYYFYKQLKLPDNPFNIIFNS